MPVVMAAAAAVQAVTSIGTAIAGVQDMNKRRVYDQNFALLNFDQRQKLETLMREAGSEQARQQILAQTLGSANVARIDALARVQAEKEKTKKTLIIVGLGGILLLATVFIISRKR